MKLLLLSLLLSLILCSCANQRSVPAYPAGTAAEPCLWYEGGTVWLIDQNGSHIVGHYKMRF